jgi:agmatine deiminase
MTMSSKHIVLPAEWEPQDAVQITWPDALTDWAYMLDQAVECFKHIAKAISDRQKLIVVCRNPDETAQYLMHCNRHNILFVVSELNDTWARDHGAITVYKNGRPTLLDVGFNGWGNKFDATSDNGITRTVFSSGIFSHHISIKDYKHFILEGGSIESDGEGTLLTTSECLLSKHRNPQFSKVQIEDFLKQHLGAINVLWLEHGYLSGDDTDSHIDTLARFCSRDTIAYVKCSDKDDEHYTALQNMEMQLSSFRKADGTPYNLVALPMATPVFDPDDGHRLPATYANFLFINGAVLVPVYGLNSDSEAIDLFVSLFPEREIIPIDCSALIRQHGSLHCVTMQYPAGVF